MLYPAESHAIHKKLFSENSASAFSMHYLNKETKALCLFSPMTSDALQIRSHSITRKSILVQNKHSTQQTAFEGLVAVFKWASNCLCRAANEFGKCSCCCLIDVKFPYWPHLCNKCHFAQMKNSREEGKSEKKTMRGRQTVLQPSSSHTCEISQQAHWNWTNRMHLFTVYNLYINKMTIDLHQHF